MVINCSSGFVFDQCQFSYEGKSLQILAPHLRRFALLLTNWRINWPTTATHRLLHVGINEFSRPVPSGNRDKVDMVSPIFPFTVNSYCVVDHLRSFEISVGRLLWLNVRLIALDSFSSSKVSDSIEVTPPIYYICIIRIPQKVHIFWYFIKIKPKDRKIAGR